MSVIVRILNLGCVFPGAYIRRWFENTTGRTTTEAGMIQIRILKWFQGIDRYTHTVNLTTQLNSGCPGVEGRWESVAHPPSALRMWMWSRRHEPNREGKKHGLAYGMSSCRPDPCSHNFWILLIVESVVNISIVTSVQWTPLKFTLMISSLLNSSHRQVCPPNLKLQKPRSNHSCPKTTIHCQYFPIT